MTPGPRGGLPAEAGESQSSFPDSSASSAPSAPLRPPPPPPARASAPPGRAVFGAGGAEGGGTPPGMAACNGGEEAAPAPAPGPAPGYGTAGFRAEAARLRGLGFRAGLLAALRSAAAGGRAAGVAVTASHNPGGDNGLKVAGPGGGMLEVAWEAHAEALARAGDAAALRAAVAAVATAEGVPMGPALVLVSRDTRPSGEALSQEVLAGAQSLAGAVVEDLGVLTTPQLHWAVMRRNQGRSFAEGDYFSELAAATRALAPRTASDDGDAPRGALVVDCANGVGALKARAALEAGLAGMGVRLELLNAETSEVALLNAGCGADFVQKERRIPRGLCADSREGGRAEGGRGTRYVSLDGDADRLVYFRPAAGDAAPGLVDLLDGDRIAILLAVWLSRLVGGLRPELAPEALGRAPRLGVVQTAYANGASTAYMTEVLGLPVATARTGVKHLHAAAEQFDLGVYFEANGHGTALFGEAFSGALSAAGAGGDTAAEALLQARTVLSQAVGDGLGGILAVECALAHLGWGADEWLALYADLPSSAGKVPVRDRNCMETSSDELTVVRPVGLQALVDQAVAAAGPGARSFVRPSGTEDIVRVYAEATTPKAAANLMERVSAATSEALA